MLKDWCGSLGLVGSGTGLTVTLLLAGAAGSVMHCVPMCGPIVLGQVSDRLARVPQARLCEASRLRNALLLPYHAGRLLTYAALGATAAAVGGNVQGIAWLGWSSSALLATAALLFLMQALRVIAPTSLRLLPRAGTAPAGISRAIRRQLRGLDLATIRGGFLLGLALGFLPCGFLYAAIAAAAAAGSALGGATAMLGFGLGTIPVLVAAGLAGHSAGQRFRRGIIAATPVLLVANAVLLAVLAWDRLHR